MQKIILALVLLSTFFIMIGYSQSPTDLDSINWAYDKIEQGKTNRSDTTFATDCFRQALRIGKKTNNNILMEIAFSQLGYHYYMAGHKNRSLYYCRNSIKQAKMHSKKTNKFTMFYLIAEIHLWSGNYRIALDSLTIAEEYAKKFKNNKQLLSSYSKRTIIYSFLNQLDLTEELLQKAIQLSLREKDTPYLSSFYDRLGDLARKRKQYDKAIKYYNKAIKIVDITRPVNFNEIKSYDFNQLGNIYTKKKEFILAKEYHLLALKNAVDAGSKYYTSSSLTDLIEVESELGHFNHAFNYLSRLDSMGKAEHVHTLMNRYKALGNLYNKMNILDSSLYYFKKGLHLKEKRKAETDISRFRVGFSSRDFTLNLKIGAIYRTLFDSTQNIAFFDSLFKYENNYRSRSLFENNESTLRSQSSPYESAVRNVETFYKDIRLLKHNDNSNVVEDLDHLKYNLVSKRLELLKDKAPDLKKIRRKEFQKYLAKNNSCAVIYTITELSQFVLYLDSTNLMVIDLNVTPDALQENIKLLMSAAFYSKGIKHLEYKSGIAYGLYLTLWQPLEKKINIPQNVIIIPDQSILNLPFDILLNKQMNKQGYSIADKPDYLNNLLVQKYNFSYLPSANLIKAFKSPNKNENTLLVANPEFNQEYKIKQNLINHTGWSFEPLLYSYKEVQSIRKLFEKSLVFNGEKARKAQFNDHLSSSKIIHFATHAFVDTVFDLFSGLVLSTPKDSTDNGFLLGYEIDQLNLNCDLVTLSACESGRGKIISAEGVMGLPRLFFGAGARTVLMALWKIDDMQSAALIPLFYENIKIRHLSKTEALGEAKRIFINSENYQNGKYYAYPFYWAAFNLYGDGGDLTISTSKLSTSTAFIASILSLVCLIIFVYYYKRKY